MAFLDANERAALLEELRHLTFNQAKGRLQRLDPKARLAIYRNVQNVNQWMTRYELPSKGTRVTLIEEQALKDDKGDRDKVQYVLKQVIVEPTAQNRM
jgi:hypothetical protein